MILDSELILSGTVSSGTWTGQRVCDAGTTEYSTDYIDTLAAGDAFKPGARLKVVATEIMAGTGATLTVSLETDDNSSFSSATTLISTGAIAKASTVAGTVLIDAVIPAGVERYLRIKYVCDATSFETTGKCFAAIVLDTDRTLDRSL